MGEEIAHRLPTDAERADAPALIRPEVRSKVRYKKLITGEQIS
jgi:hypothetical protein